MKKVFRFNKNERVKEVYINGIKNSEYEDYTVKGNKLKFNETLDKGDLLTFMVEKIEKV